MKNKTYDFVVLGAGGTGLAAAMYAARLGLNTLVLGHTHGTERSVGGVITTTHIVENYPGFTRISGPDLAKKIEEHTKSYDLVKVKEERVEEIRKLKNIFHIKTNKSYYKTKTVLFATGTKWRKLDVPGSKEFENKGVSYCALCDATLFRNKVVAVIGGSDGSAKDALLLADYAKKVYIINRGKEIHPEPINMNRIKTKKKIEIINNTNVKRINGDKFVESLSFDESHNGKKELKVDGIFVAIGHVPLSDLAKSMRVNLNKKGEIKINYMTAETNIPGVFAAGDVTDRPFKQLITGVADGCTAAYTAYEHINKNKL